MYPRLPLQVLFAGGRAKYPHPRTMSFRNRLRLFFLMIVVAPMLVVAVAFYVLVFSSESGKADAQANAERRVAMAMYDEAHARALVAGRAIARDMPFATAIRRQQRRGAADPRGRPAPHARRPADRRRAGHEPCPRRRGQRIGDVPREHRLSTAAGSSARSRPRSSRRPRTRAA